MLHIREGFSSKGLVSNLILTQQLSAERQKQELCSALVTGDCAASDGGDEARMAGGECGEKEGKWTISLRDSRAQELEFRTTWRR